MKIVSIILGILAVLMITVLAFLIVKNNELSQENIVLKQASGRILEKAKNYLLSEGRTFIPGNGTSCAEKTEECLDYWTSKLASGSVNKSPCDFTNSEVGCGRDDLYLISPNGGEHFCIGDDMTISWKAPVDAESITIRLRESGLYGESFDIDTFPASFNEFDKQNGEGTTLWKIPQNVDESLVYKLWVNIVYGGSSINDSSDGVFSIQRCGE